MSEALEITAIAFGSGDKPPLGDGRHTHDGDIELVKPALLYADEVTLRTSSFYFRRHRLQTMQELDNDGLMSLLFLVAAASDPKGRDALRAAGIRPEILPEQPEARTTIDAFNDQTDDMAQLVNRFEWRHSQFLTEARPKYLAAIRAEHEDMQTSDLDLAVAAGLLKVAAHTEVAGIDAPWESRSVANDVISEGWGSMRRLAMAAKNPLMVDAWDKTLLGEFPFVQLDRLDTATRMGAAQLTGLPTVENASISEILDLRSELSKPLIRLRAALTQEISEIPESHDDYSELLRTIQSTAIDPAITELDELVAENAGWSGLLQRSSPLAKIGLAGGGLLLGVATGGIGPLVAVGAAAAVAGSGIADLATDSRAKRKSLESHPFYFLHRLSKS